MRVEIVDLILGRVAACRDSIEAQWLSPVGTTTRHFYIDDLLPQELVESAYAAYPRDGSGFFSRETFREKKRTSAQLSDYPPILGEITYAMQAASVIAKISELTGIKGMEPDPALYAGGLSMMFKDDFLNPHIDNSHDSRRNRYRRLNLLYYVSPDWALEDGGNFEMWNEARTEPCTVVSKCNRLVVMETNKTSWHSVSKVAVDRPRCCISNYYFSQTSPDQTQYFHITSFDGRPDEPIKKIICAGDNALRSVVAKTLKVGRGKGLMNRSAEENRPAGQTDS
jgi:Rps23 Pro-64 3,4-dihydroxylase Tpa1-like proline 4-hydroxylase